MERPQAMKELASQLAQKDPPLFSLCKKIRRYRTKVSKYLFINIFRKMKNDGESL